MSVPVNDCRAWLDFAESDLEMVQRALDGEWLSRFAGDARYPLHQPLPLESEHAGKARIIARRYRLFCLERITPD